MRNSSFSRRGVLWCVTFFATVGVAQAEQIKVMLPQGSAHGFVEVTTMEGTRIAVGDLKQKLRGGVVTSQLTLKFLDGSLDDETTVYSQSGTFRFISDHHVQHGPSFPAAVDTIVDAPSQSVTIKDAAGKSTRVQVDMPPDVYNGLASSLLMNVLPTTPETNIAVVVPSEKPRIVHLSMKNAGEVPFTMAGMPRKAIDYVVHVELGGVAGVIAPLVGKEPLDFHVWILAGGDPAFIREEGQLYEGGPVWRIQQVSAVFKHK
jgi:hypothetical protein